MTAARLARRVFGPTLVNQYLPAFRNRGHTAPYDAKSTWTLRYEEAVERRRFDDATTIAPEANPLLVRYHYNAVENAVLEQALALGFPASPSVLDVGSGAGHWIDFYREVLGAASVVGVEISSSAAGALAGEYEDVPDVAIVEGDVAAEQFQLGRRFDIVNAVDALFHIVDDAAWQRAVRNLAAHLEPGGVMVVAEHVGLVTHDAGFRRDAPDVALVSKRVRSERRWKACARAAGLGVVRSSRIRKRRTHPTPANRVIVLARRGSRSDHESDEGKRREKTTGAASSSIAKTKK
jgi:SAM-dependent methyltransferase